MAKKGFVGHLKNRKVAAIILVAVLAIGIGASIWILLPNFIKPPTYQLWELYYDDGSHRPIVPSQLPTHNFVDPTLNKGVIKVTCAIHAIVTYTGTISGYSFDGDAIFQLYSSTGAFITNIGTAQSTQGSGGSIPSGSDVVIWSGEVDVSTLESLYGGWQTGTEYYLAVNATKPSTLTLTFAPNGNQVSKSIMPDGAAWLFRYEAPYQFTSLQLLFGMGQGYAQTSYTLTIRAWDSSGNPVVTEIYVDGDLITTDSMAIVTVAAGSTHQVSVQPFGYDIYGNTVVFNSWDSGQGNPLVLTVTSDTEVYAWFT